MKTITGRVKWFNNEKGFGFIEYKNGEDIFIHYSAILSDDYRILSKRDIVEFTLARANKEYKTKKVVLKLSKKIKNQNVKEKIETLGAIANIVCMIIAMLPNDDSKIKNQINVNCNDCEINIIEKSDDINVKK